MPYMFDLRPRQPLAPVFVDLDEDLVMTVKVGPKGISVTRTTEQLIMFLAKRG